MTYYQLITELKNCALEEPNIRFAGSKDIFELNSLPDIEYSVFYITPNPFNCQPFYQKFKDMCCGVYFTVTFEIDSVLGLCGDE